MRNWSDRIAAALAVLALLAWGVGWGAVPAQAASHRAHHLPSWHLLDTGQESHYRGLAAVNARVAWLGGYNGLVLRTHDGGRNWIDASPAGAGTMQFRDISAFNSRHAVAMAAGTKGDSRLYFTNDGGQHWRLAYRNHSPAAFFDCMSFFNPRHGLVMSDPVDGRFRILATTDGGRHWKILSSAGMPAALEGEFGFAASGECLTTAGHHAWFGTGGAGVARVFHSSNAGQTWHARTTPIVSGPSAGVFGLAFRTPSHGVATGGDFAEPSANQDVAAYSLHGQPWLSSTRQPTGYRSGVTFVPGTETVISVGLTGSDISRDGGRSWTTFDTGQFDTVSCTSDGACWASGDEGRVAVLHR